MEFSTKVLRGRQGTIRRNWGFQTALWCSIHWATCYVGVELLLQGDTFMGVPYVQRDLAMGAVVFSILMVLLITFICIVWMAITGRLGEYFNMLRYPHKDCHLYMVCAAMGCLGEPIIYYTGSLLNSAFVTAMTLFYPLIGTLMARFWYREIVPRMCWVGLAFVLGGCFILYFPLVLDTTSGVFLLYVVAGLLVGIDWGVEGGLSSRVQDTTDSSVGVAVRYTYELGMWAVILVASLLMVPGCGLPQQVASVAVSPDMLFILLLAGCLAFDYFGWYKSFALCGVCCGMAVTDISGYVAAIVATVVTLTLPSWSTVGACLVTMVGVFIIYYSGKDLLGAIRDVDVTPMRRDIQSRRHLSQLPLKGRAIVMIAQQGTAWDWELADAIAQGPRRRRQRNEVQLSLIEAAAAGMIVALEENVDDGAHFAEGKLLSRYSLTRFGYERLLSSGLVEANDARQRAAVRSFRLHGAAYGSERYCAANDFWSRSMADAATVRNGRQGGSR